MYTKHIEEEKARKEKDMQQNAKMDNEDHDTQNIPKELESRKRSLLEVQNTITKKQASQEEELRPLERIFRKSESIRCHQN